MNIFILPLLSKTFYIKILCAILKKIYFLSFCLVAVSFTLITIQAQTSYFYNVYGANNKDQCLFMDKGLNGGMILGGYVTIHQPALTF